VPRASGARPGRPLAGALSTRGGPTAPAYPSSTSTSDTVRTAAQGEPKTATTGKTGGPAEAAEDSTPSGSSGSGSPPSPASAEAPPPGLPSPGSVLARAAGELPEPGRDVQPEPKPSAPPILPAPGSPVAPGSEDSPSAGPFHGLGRVFVELDGPRSRTTSQPIETVSGRVVGGLPQRLTLLVNGVPHDLSLADRSFVTSVPLERGGNVLRAVATGPGGAETEDMIEILYVPPPSPNGIVILRPKDGLSLGEDDPPIVVVEGDVADRSIATITLTANDQRIPVRVQDGRFRHLVPVLAPLLRLRAEVQPREGPVQKSEPVMVTASGREGGAAIVVIGWPPEMKGVEAEVTAAWREAPDRLDSRVRTIRLKPFADGPAATPPEAFYFQGPKPGAYTFTLRHRQQSARGSARPTLHLAGQAGSRSRPLAEVLLGDVGRAVIARLLMPHGILWEEDDWFSGKSESVDTVTKFRFPEGISWVERKADLP
jgi:hypothetical protein